ncbi:hypothetical protein [Streptococcus phocae]|uniref:Uncharacterized protein n=1 Tax=Streptococcus phocae TaxID=119224 RepID=A0A0P6SD91_9STRE|nr:hypothetical protein [Streptococcus phocae]KPJ22016.1 hypothetical protein AKK44_06575 [Streptococcus phocae]
MKKTLIILVLSVFFLNGCTNNKETAKNSFSNEDRIIQTPSSEESSSKTESSSTSKSESSTSEFIPADSSKDNISSSSNTTPYSLYVADYVSLNHIKDGQALRDAYGHVFRDGFYIHRGIMGSRHEEVGMVYQLSQGIMVDNTLILGPDEAKQFLDWIRQIAPSGTTKNRLKSNYDYWTTNIKDK